MDYATAGVIATGTEPVVVAVGAFTTLKEAFNWESWSERTKKRDNLCLRVVLLWRPEFLGV